MSAVTCQMILIWRGCVIGVRFLWPVEHCNKIFVAISHFCKLESTNLHQSRSQMLYCIMSMLLEVSRGM